MTPVTTPKTETRRKPLSMNQMLRKVDRFNARFPVGTRVEFRAHPVALPMRTYVTAPAFILSGHTPCVLVKGIASCVAIDAITAPVGPLVREPADVR